MVLGFDPYSYFGCQSLYGCYVPIDVGPIPRFKKRVINQNERYLELMTETGAIARRFKSAEYTWYSMPMFLEFPVKDQKTWEEYKRRLNPEDERRYPKDWHKDAYIDVLENFERLHTWCGSSCPRRIYVAKVSGIRRLHQEKTCLTLFLSNAKTLLRFFQFIFRKRK